mmetsp:Transcript_39527/g.65542  ORF Transcript_39527/g.65542 Transcript_39527/m.65542 type:complete len:468 (-) Transcript_39527:500-1903(-)
MSTDEAMPPAKRVKTEDETEASAEVPAASPAADEAAEPAPPELLADDAVPPAKRLKTEEHTTTPAEEPSATEAPRAASTEEAAAPAPPELVAEASGVTFIPGAAPGEEAEAPKTDEEVKAAILRQVEYYFSDTNLVKDKFLKIEQSKSEERWVAISVLTTFNRMKVLVPSLNVATIADAMRVSKTVEVSEDGTKVRVHPSLVKPSEVTLGGKLFKSRAEVVAYAQPLLKGDETLSDEHAQFVKDLLQHHQNPKEKEGSGIVSVKAGYNPDFPDTKCFVLVRSDETEMDFSYVKCLNNIFPMEVEPFQKRFNRNKRKAAGAESEGASTSEAQPPADDYTKGTIVLIRELPEGNDILKLRQAFGVAGTVRFVELVPDQPLAYVRFEKAEHATKALEVTGLGELSLLEGEDEKQYWEKIGIDKGGKGKGGRGGRGRGGKGGGKGKGKGKGGKGKGGKGGRGRGRGGGDGD